MTPPRTRSTGSTVKSTAPRAKKSSSLSKSSQPVAKASKQGAKRSATSSGEKAEATSGSTRSASAPRAAARPRSSAAEVARHVAQGLADLIGKEPGKVTQLQRTDDGWSVHVEVLELRRIPETMDMLALYEVEADEYGALQGYRRLRRYVRGVPGEE